MRTPRDASAACTPRDPAYAGKQGKNMFIVLVKRDINLLVTTQFMLEDETGDC